jgi:hypothetical protein
MFKATKDIVSENEAHEVNVRIIKAWLVLLNERPKFNVECGLVAELAIFVIKLENKMLYKC